MSKIVEGIRGFASSTLVARRSTPALEPLKEAAQLLSESLKGRAVAVTWQLEDCAPRILADPDRLQQVFINLIDNAADAVGELGSGGTIRLSLTTAGPWVVYAVEDSGGGVPAEIQKRIFDPFFTTKPTGQGSGLGLSISHGIVREHSGSLDYEPSQLGGARFVVRLPGYFEDGGA
jgi:histidine kinase